MPSIVTLLAAATEIAAAVGAADELVGISPTSATTHPTPSPAGPC